MFEWQEKIDRQLQLPDGAEGGALCLSPAAFSNKSVTSVGGFDILALRGFPGISCVKSVSQQNERVIDSSGHLSDVVRRGLG